jgi:lipocalin
MKILISTFILALSINSFAGKKNIIDVAKEAGNFKTLITALEATGLDKAIEQSKKITVFAPNDEAFAKLPAGTVEALLQDKETLSKILLYHVSPKKLKAKKVIKLNEIKTLQGQTILTNKKDGEFFLNDSKIIATDIKAKNGIIHVIDNVLLFDSAKPSNTFETAQNIELKKYMGLWYEYARYENEFQKECLGTTAKYELKKAPINRKTYVKVTNTCIKADGKIQSGKAKAFVVNKETNAQLKVSFVPLLNWFGLFSGDYNILKVGPDYEYALVGDQDRSNFWILSRTKEMPEALYQELLDVAQAKGFRKELIRKSPVFTH